MGIYDRDYERGRNYGYQPGFHLGAPRTMTTNLVIVMLGVYVVQWLTMPAQPTSPIDDGWFTNTLRLYGDVLKQPWMAFEFVTYGFLHDPGDLKHILFNMLGLWIFGRPVEQLYGRREYLTFFLVAIVFAGLVWVLGEFAANHRLVGIPMLGASGGISAVLILFALNFPHQTVLFMFVLPMPMWVLAVILVGIDAVGAMDRSGTVACTAHLGGALFGFLYYQRGLRLARWLPDRSWLKRLRPKPKLRVLDPDADDTTDSRVDQILQKIQEQGQDSLTYGERRFLEKASREYQKKRQ